MTRDPSVHGSKRCVLCEGVCPQCGGPLGEGAGSGSWILCSPCHTTYSHVECGYATFRLATIEDGPQLARMRWEFRAEGGEQPIESFDAFVKRHSAFLREAFDSGDWVFWVAEAHGHLVAHMAVHVVRSVPRPSRSSDRWGYLTNCYTAPDLRDRGVGSKLLDRVKRWAMAEDLELLIVSPSERAHTFYARAGFVPDSEFLLLQIRGYDDPEPTDAR